MGGGDEPARIGYPPGTKPARLSEPSNRGESSRWSVAVKADFRPVSFQDLDFGLFEPPVFCVVGSHLPRATGFCHDPLYRGA